LGCILAVGLGGELEAVLAGFEAGPFEDGLVEEDPVPVFDCALEGEPVYNVSQTLRDLCERVRAEVGWVLEPAGAVELEVVLAILGVGLLDPCVVVAGQCCRSRRSS